MKKTLLGLCLGALASVAIAMPIKPIAAKQISVATPVVIAEKSGQINTELFLTLDNHSNFSERLVAATSPVARLVQLHKMERHGTMRQIKDVKVKPHQAKAMRGRLHIMLIDTYHRLVSNQLVPVTLIFADGSWKKVMAKVS